MTEDFKSHILSQPTDPITEDEVVEAYRKALQLRARRHRVEDTPRGETEQEADERMEAICAHDTLELQYLAQETR